MANGFDLPLTRSIISDIAQQRQFEQSTAGQMQKLQFQQAMDESERRRIGLDLLSQAKTMEDYRQALPFFDPGAAVEMGFNLQRQQQAQELLSQGNISAAIGIDPNLAHTPVAQAATTQAQLKEKEPFAVNADLRERETRIAVEREKGLQRVNLENISLSTGKKLSPFASKQLQQAAVQIAKLENVPVILDGLQKQWEDLDPKSGLLGKLEAIGEKTLGDLGIAKFAGASSYDQTALGISKQVSRSLGDVGNIAVQEQEINRKMLPKATDNAEQGYQKLQNLRALVQSILDNEYERVQAILTNSGIEYKQIAPSVGPPAPNQVVRQPAAQQDVQAQAQTVTNAEQLINKWKQSRQ